jgi:osmotically-inducible protein OsmY
MNQLLIVESRHQSGSHNEPNDLRPPLRGHQIEISVWEQWQASERYELQQLKCEFSDGVLLLFGQVSSFYLKQLAQESVRDVAGVNRILNQLEVNDLSTTHR